MATLNVYVPDELKKRMDKVGDRANWSAAAQDAFEHELAKDAIRQQKGTKMNAVAERLQRSKEQAVKAWYESGFAAGREWAQLRADYGQLEALDEAADMEMAVACLTRWDRDETLDLSEELADPDAEAPPTSGKTHDEELEGFVNGALEVFHEVKDEL